MDSISMYEALKEKHSKQEAVLKEDVTEKLTTVDIGNVNAFDVKRKVQVEGQSVSAKTVFMNVFSQEYVDRLAATDADYITKDRNMSKVALLSQKTMKNAENLDKIHQYSANHTGRNEKTRNTHREKVHKYANQLILNSGVHRRAISNYVRLSSKAELTPDEKKTLKKEFMKKYKLDLEVIEQEYQMNKNLLMMGGNKDVSEEDSLFRLRYTKYAKALAANSKGLEMARRYPELFDAAYFQKQLDKIAVKIKKLGETASPALMESKKKYFTESGTRRAIRLSEKATEERKNRESDEIKAKHGKRIQGIIDRYIARKSENGTAEEKLWLQENLKLNNVARALTNGKGSDILLSEKHRKGMGAEFFETFDQAMELFLDRYLFDIATEITTEEEKELLKAGVPAAGIDRSVRTQLHPVRKCKNGHYVSVEDEQNDAFNRKYIEALKSNDMKARKECIEENLIMLLTYKFNTENLKAEDYYDQECWQKFMIARLALGISNLKNDGFAANSKINDNKEITRELLKNHVHGTVKVAGKDWDYITFAAHLTAYYSFMAMRKFNVDPGTNVLANDAFHGAPGTFDILAAELQTFVDGYKALQNGAA